MNVPSRADQATAMPSAGMRLSYSRRRLQVRSSRRLSPRATIDHSPRATVGIPMPPVASKLIDDASAPARGRVPAWAAVPERSDQEGGGQPARSQDQPAREEIGLKRIEPAEEDDQYPAGAAESISQPVRAGGRSSWSSERAARCASSIECSALGDEPRRLESIDFGVHGRPRDGGPEQVPECPGQRSQQADERPEAGRRPDFEEHVVGIEDLFARLRQLVSQVGAREIAGPDAPPERGRGTGHSRATALRR